MKSYTYNGKKNVTGEKIYLARTAEKLSQDALSGRLAKHDVSICRDAISKIENGDRLVRDYELMAIAKICKTTVAHLIGED